MANKADLFDSVIAPILSALDESKALAIRRDGTNPDHVVAQPPLTRDQAIEWLFEGRRHPPEERFRPDPIQGNETDPQERFLFRPLPDEIRDLRKNFAKRWLDSGPGWFIEGALPNWVPKDVRTQIGELDRAGALRRSLAPIVHTFDGTPPYGPIIMWYGKGDFLSRDELFVYQEFPEDLDFYTGLTGIDSDQARLLHQVYTSYNKDMYYFVVGRRWKPDLAREELERIWGAVFRQVLETATTIVSTGVAIGGLNEIPRFADQVVEAALNSFRGKRQLFSLWARNRSPFMVLFRGTSFKKILGDLARDLEHDLGRGTYFTTAEKVAEFYRKREALAGNPGRMIKLSIRDEAELGRTLNLLDGPLASKWKALVSEWQQSAGTTGLANETYNKLLTGFLGERNLSMNDFDTIIAYEYLRGAVQICVKSEEIARRLVTRAEEIAL